MVHSSKLHQEMFKNSLCANQLMHNVVFRTFNFGKKTVTTDVICWIESATSQTNLKSCRIQSNKQIKLGEGTSLATLGTSL